LWYPLSLDTINGGFFSDINFKWEVEGPQDKMIVTQARHIWASSNGYMHYKKNECLKSVATHGVKFLRQEMWDKKYGGFYDLVTRIGDPIEEHGMIVKKVYGNAFAIYALAACYEAFHEESVLEFAQEAFHWVDRHAHDNQLGGYSQFMARDGTPMVDGYEGVPPKDQNSTIHLLEAFTELYRVWPDKVVGERLRELLQLVRDTITTEKGYMVLFFTRDWTPMSFRESDDATRQRNYEFDHVSFGHDIETACLMLEASAALGLKNDEKTLAVGKRMIDHCLKFGWDKERGGIYDGGYYFSGRTEPTIVKNTKEWWTQVETLNSCLLMSHFYPKEQTHYFGMFRAQWEYCRKYLIDNEHGGWYWGGIDIVPDNKRSPKSTIWKCNYHTSRALINCIARLK
jgi:mannobiose 2-epimerase